MKLAEALRLIVDLRNQLSRTSERVYSENRVEASEPTTTEMYSVLQTYDALSGKLLRLKTAINRANMENTVTYPSYYDNIKHFMDVGDAGSNEVSEKLNMSTKSIMEALAEREQLHSDISSYKSFLSSTEVGIRSYEGELKKKSQLDSTRLRKRVDAMSKYLRLADTKIQENNWLVEFEFE